MRIFKAVTTASIALSDHESFPASPVKCGAQYVDSELISQMAKQHGCHGLGIGQL
jgi:hypothetical protein